MMLNLDDTIRSIDYTFGFFDQFLVLFLMVHWVGNCWILLHSINNFYGQICIIFGNDFTDECT